MITIIFCLFILTLLLGLAFKLTGALLKACLWLFVFVPVGLFLACLGILCCCTLILIPVGISLLKTCMRVIIP
ncbi:MAG: hypothetical protein MR425_06550 [Lachnospiraceae bacterium]|nr:hypothetical protein [Lachnospiraceae bacterium]